MIVPCQRLAAEDREQPLVIALKCPLMRDEFDHDVVARMASATRTLHEIVAIGDSVTATIRSRLSTRSPPRSKSANTA